MHISCLADLFIDTLIRSRALQSISRPTGFIYMMNDKTGELIKISICAS
jgi:hypothetical protein